MKSGALKRFMAPSAFAACLAVFSLMAAGTAAARAPWWHVNTISAPASQPGGEGMLILEVSNLGDAPVNGFANPVTIIDALPPGVTPEHVHGEGGGSFPIGINGVKEAMQCNAAAQIVTCTYEGPLLAYERFMIAISARVQPGAGGGESAVSVSGGGAPPLSWRHPLSLSGPPSPFGAQNYELTPEEENGAPDTQAGSHPFQLTTTLTFDSKAVAVENPYHASEKLPEVQPVGLAKELRFDLPAGLIGNPTPLPKCRLSVFVKPSNTSRCPDSTVVGVATPITTNTYSPPYVPFAEAVPIYSLEPAVGEPARFGFTTQVGPVVLDTAVRTGGDYGVVVSVPDIPDDIGFIGSQVTFWGVPADARHDTSRGQCLDEYEGTVREAHQWEFACPLQESPQPFLIMPTSCTGPLQTSVQGESWEQIGELTAPKVYTVVNSLGKPASQTGCNRLSFDPSIDVAPDGQQGSTPTGLTVDVHVDQEASLNPTGLAESEVKDTTVALPEGIALNPAAADGLSACTIAQVGLESPGEQACPESSKVGTVEVRTPLLANPLTGAAYLATQYANPFGSLLALYIVVKDPVSGVLVKLAGEVRAQEGTGQLISTFKQTPQLPFEDLVLRFFGGARAPLGTPALCGSYTTVASFDPWSGKPPVQAASVFRITSGPGASPCFDPLPFGPSLTGGSLNLQAGAFTPFTVTMSREDGNQNLRALRLQMPPGLLGMISDVKLCGEAQANTGTCGPESLIGHTTVSVGLGSSPYTVTGGEVFITGPYEGAPYGLSIVTPAKAGPFDLGKTIVRARIEVDPITAALTVVSDASGQYAIPQFIDGIPLQIKHINVTVDRPQFTFNPTSCSPMAIHGSLTSSAGSSSALEVPFQVTNCATLGFKPILTASTAARTSRARGASLRVRLTYPKAPFGSQANIAAVKVSLPKQLPSRLSTLQKACPDATFDTNPAACPPASRVGTATATTPVLPRRLQGPAYFVSHGGAKFPELIIALSGEGIVVYLHGETFISKAGITSSTFRTLPDVPIGAFELNLPQGHDSALSAHGSLCAAKLKMPAAFVAANGKRIKRTITIKATGCPRKGHKARRARRHGRAKRRP